MNSFIQSKKGKIIIAAVCLAIIVLALVLFFVFGGEKGYRTISISDVFGSVMTENDGKEYEAYENMRLTDGYILTTDNDSYTRMILDDEKYVKLEEKSKASFEDLGTKKKKSTVIRLEQGVLTNEITVPLEKEEIYEVNTPNATLSVRGTFFRVEVREDENGDAYTDVYTYGGTVACKRIMPDGTVVDEEVLVHEGYKACIKMDEVITVYVEEIIEEKGDDVDPLNVKSIPDWDLVDIYNASIHGHKMFCEADILWNEIENREIDIDKYTSAYDKEKIEKYPDYKKRVENENHDKDNNKYDDDKNSAERPEKDDKSPNSDSQSAGNDVDDDADNSRDDRDSNRDNSENNRDDYFDRNHGSNNSDRDNHTRPQGENNGHFPNIPSRNDEEYIVTTVPDTYDDSDETPVTVSSENNEADEDDEDENEDIYDDNEDIFDPDDEFDDDYKDEILDDDYSDSTVTLPPVLDSWFDDFINSDSTSAALPETEHVHVFGEYVSDNNADCTNDGTKTAKCACGETDTVIDVGTATGHTSETITTDATCTEDGAIIEKCTVCGDEITNTPIPATGHIEEIERVEPTFVQAGYVKTYCTVCGEVIENEILDKLPALYTEDGSITITSTGYTQGDSDEIAYTGDYVISQRDSSTAVDCSITVESGTHNVTLDGVNFTGFGNVIKISKATVNIFGTANKNICKAINNNDGITDTPLNVGIQATVTINSGCFEFISEGNKGLNSLGTGSLMIYGGSTLFSGLDYDMYFWPNATFKILGGSLKLNNNLINDYVSPSNSYGDTLECVVYDTFPTEAERTFTNSDGTTYVYTLTESDKADDGKYYVWKPIDLGVEINDTNFPDTVFREYVSTKFDSDADGYLSDEETDGATMIVIGTASSTNDSGLASLKGIEYFKKLKLLSCYWNLNLKELDLSNNTELTSLYCPNTGIINLNVSNNTVLETLECYECNLAYINLTNNTNLTSFSGYDNSYVIPTNSTEFDTSTITGFDPSKVSNVTNADFDQTTGMFTNITGDITYIYDCGQGYTATFTLTRTG